MSGAAPVLFRTLPCRSKAGGGALIGVATLNAPATLNALSLEMIALLETQLAAWEADPAVVLVMLEGAGDKAFCAGGDLQQLYRSMREHHASPQSADPLANAYAREFFGREYALDLSIHTYAKPVLAWGHGIVMGGGIGLMAGASHRVVTEASRLAMPEVAIGLYPDVGGSWFLSRAPGHTGPFLALTGAALNAADAQFARLADYRLAHADKARLIDMLQSEVWAAPGTVAPPGANHHMLGAMLAKLQKAAPPAPASPLREHYDLINELCASGNFGDMVLRIASLESEDRWLQKAATALRKGSPGAAWLAVAIQQRAKYLSLAEVFQLELDVSLICAARPDFAEGIRALIIDKDMQPRWQPASLADVGEAWGEGFFTQLERKTA
ncbi:enoyl-CoA hydratase/isomerase family protein [Pseudoduganella aquatica]|uniref:3-hydroxyisobutyryl-CoA hydrolase n=1 Tax=Pseudoduganella aquatica TaxID=2660641 RepID=A0A7X4KKN4_9BURK|nr:enoyl-CoA hydratase/isomerase family protein [Pseudoduganella aquatica]MYN06208.1 enoyl-CoA hydratase/isomerase family protein [Pseudoduganella aquatica]